MAAGTSGKKVAERRWFLFEVSENPDYQDYSGLSVSLINFAPLV
jgi:hypothetical protein